MCQYKNILACWPDISILDRNAYGYFDDEMLPLSRDRAAEFLRRTWAYICCMRTIPRRWHLTEDITNHGGIFGIECTDWIAFKDYEALKEAEKFSISEMEQRFLKSYRCFAIYQLKKMKNWGIIVLKGWRDYKRPDFSIEHDNYEMV